MSSTKVAAKQLFLTSKAFQASLDQHSRVTGKDRCDTLKALEPSLHNRQFDFEGAGLSLQLVKQYRRYHAAGQNLISLLGVPSRQPTENFWRGTLLRRLVLKPTRAVAKTGEFQVVAVAPRRARPDYLDFLPPRHVEIAKEYATQRKTVNDPVSPPFRDDSVLVGLPPSSRALHKSVTSDECPEGLLVPVKELLGTKVRVVRIDKNT